MQIFKGDSQSNSMRIMQMHSFRAEITCRRRPSKALLQALNTGTNATKSTFFGKPSVLQIAWTSLCTSSIQALHGSVALPGPGGVKSPVSALPACSCHRTAPHPIKWLFRKMLRKWLKKKNICTIRPVYNRRAGHVSRHRTAPNEWMRCSARLTSSSAQCVQFIIYEAPYVCLLRAISGKRCFFCDLILT